MKKPNPKEMNAYLRDNGTGYPDEATGAMQPVSCFQPLLLLLLLLAGGLKL